MTPKAWVDVALGATSDVEVDGGVLLAVGIVVTVGVGEKIGVGVDVKVGVEVIVGVGVVLGVFVGVGVSVGVAVSVGVRVGVGLGVEVELGVNVGRGVGLCNPGKYGAGPILPGVGAAETNWPATFILVGVPGVSGRSAPCCHAGRTGVLVPAIGSGLLDCPPRSGAFGSSSSPRLTPSGERSTGVSNAPISSPFASACGSVSTLPGGHEPSRSSGVGSACNGRLQETGGRKPSGEVTSAIWFGDSSAKDPGAQIAVTRTRAATAAHHRSASRRGGLFHPNTARLYVLRP